MAFLDNKKLDAKQRGKPISAEEEIELFRICKRHEKSYGRKGEKEGMAHFWNLVVTDFNDYRGNIPYSAKSCQRRVTSKMMQRKLELQMEEIGSEKRCTDWTIAIDAWKDVVELYETTEKEKKRLIVKFLSKSVVTDQEKDRYYEATGHKRKRGNSATMMSEAELEWEEENSTGYKDDWYEYSADQFSPIPDQQSLYGISEISTRAESQCLQDKTQIMVGSFSSSISSTPKIPRVNEKAKKQKEVNEHLAELENSVEKIYKQNERIEGKLDKLIALMKK